MAHVSLLTKKDREPSGSAQKPGGNVDTLTALLGGGQAVAGEQVGVRQSEHWGAGSWGQKRDPTGPPESRTVRQVSHGPREA